MMLLFTWNGAATTVLPGPFAVGGRHQSRSSTSAQLLSPLPKELQHLARFKCKRLRSYAPRGRRQARLKNVVQIARKPCPEMETGVVSLLQGFCRV